ncbi:glycosyltransferase [uncultured Winogradskyella sp.]|uniref:glycosyltransferase family 2 protein n=1 Tax=uncultured Winogradskyella sp. TaxID=395353 RepID=UPI00262B3594|nr:glycosyltransferase [uncultured Winogradskyella sp.]
MISIFIYGFDRVDDFKLRDLKPKTKFSIIIPFRNEAENLPKLLDSILKLNYPKNLFEVILVNDASNDTSVEITRRILNAKPFKNDFTQSDVVKIIQNNRITNAPKKDAINSAINVSKYEWIITTDADCVLPIYWLDTFDECIQTQNPNCIIAPVAYYGHTTFFNRFQALDFMSLQGVTIGGFGIKKPFLCNGANFGYQKSIFKSLNGFEGNNSIASGDDIFLLEKFKRINSKKIVYLKSKNAIVYTNPVSNFRQLIQQRLRWTSKTSQNPNWFSKFVGIIVFLANLVCMSLIPLLMLQLIAPRIALALFVIKLAIDFLLLFKTTRFLKQENVLYSFITSSLLYPFFSVYIVILSWFKSYNWKGRTFRK